MTTARIIGIQSAHRSRGRQAFDDPLSGIMLQGALEKIREISDCDTRVIDLSELTIHPCRACFSDMETRCHYLCDCFDDDFKEVARQIIAADGVLFSTPTYMFGMSSLLKRFFERWISFKAPPVRQESATKSLDECFDLLHAMADGALTAENPLSGKVGGIIVSGSELGQDNVIREIMLILNLYGFILPPQCFIYHTGHSMQSLEDVRNSFYENQWLLMATETLARAVVQMIGRVRGASWPRMKRTLNKV